MAVTTIPWGDGSGGNIYLTYPSASGDQSVSVTSDANTGAARSKVVTFSAVGVSPVSLTINQNAAPTPHTATASLRFNSYDSVDKQYDSLNNPSRAYTDTSSTTYCNVYLTKGSQAETWVYFKFDTSSIPAGAVIDSVVAKVKIFINNTASANVQTRTCQMFTGTTEKGTSQNATTSAQVRTFSGVTWTREEIADCRVKFYAKRGSSNTDTTYYFRIYGAELEVTYTYYE